MATKKQIAVFDLRAEDCAHTAGIIRDVFRNDAQVLEYTDMQKFAYTFLDRREAGKLYDMMFIGVDDFTGLETARNIRELDIGCTCPMFLVSAVEDFGLEGFRLGALDYLTKPVSGERVKRAIQRVEHKRKKADR